MHARTHADRLTDRHSRAHTTTEGIPHSYLAETLLGVWITRVVHAASHVTTALNSCTKMRKQN